MLVQKDESTKFYGTIYQLCALPAVSVAHPNHRIEDRIPRLRIFESRVGEHTTIPTDMLDSSRSRVLEPVPSALDDV